MNPVPTLRRRFFVPGIIALLVASSGAAATATTPAASAAAPPPRCTVDNTIRVWVVALDQDLVLNRFGSDIPGGMIYALERDVFPKKKDIVPADYSDKKSCKQKPETCEPGNVMLRPTLPWLPGKRPRPLVLRANEGDCLDIHFRNLLGMQQPGDTKPATRLAGVHVQGLNWVAGPGDDASNVGANGSSLVAPGKSTTYWLYAEHEGAYLLYSTADDWTQLPSGGRGDGGTLAEGLFGAVNVQPGRPSQGRASGSYRGRADEQNWHSEFYRSQVNEQDLCLSSLDKAGDPLHCHRVNPHTLPTVDYQALYPKGHPREFLPILNMVCSKVLTPDAIENDVCVEGELVHGDLTAVITGPSAPDVELPDAKPQPQAFPHSYPNEARQPPSLRPIYAYPDRFQPFREYTIIYHESFQVMQAFSDKTKFTQFPSLAAAQDSFGINYGMAGLSNEVLANRFHLGPLGRCVDCKFEEFFLSSWAMGDPAMIVDVPANQCIGNKGKGCPATATKAMFPDDPSNVYHSYISDHVRFRVLHAGADLHHLHHQHAHQWLGTPNSPDGDYLDSQSIGPGSAFTMEMVYNGSGNVNQTVGDSIFHCHFYPHFASGMWSLWRVHDVFEGGTILDENGMPSAGVEYPRALPDGEIKRGTPTVALVPLPTLPMAPLPADVRLQGVCSSKSNNPVQNCSDNPNDPPCAAGESCMEQGSRYCMVDPGTGHCTSEFQTTEERWDEVQKKPFRNPGYPFFIPGIGGSRPPHPPLDFAYACSKSGKICDPTLPQRLREAADQETREHLRSRQRPDYAAPIFEDCREDETCEPMDGGLPRAVTAQGPPEDWKTPQEDLPGASKFDFSKEIRNAHAIELPETGTLIEKVAMATHAQRFHPSRLPDGRETGTCSDNGAPCSPADLAQCGNPSQALCQPGGRINFVLNGLPPQPGAPYADPCIRFDRNGGPPYNMLTRSYLAADLQLDAIFNREGWHFPQQRILSLWGDVKDFLERKKPPEPLFMRVNSYDCMTYVLANLVPNVYELDDFQVRTPTDVIGQHIHLVKFDVTSSDGAENGWNYEDGTYAPNEVTERIDAINRAGGIFAAPGDSAAGSPCAGGKSGQRCLGAKYIKFFGPGPGALPTFDDSLEGTKTGGAWVGAQATVQRWYDDPLFNNLGRCSTDLELGCALGQAGVAPPCPRAGVCIVNAGWCLDASGEHQSCTQEDRHLCCTQSDPTLCEKALASSGSFDPAHFSSCEPKQDRTIRTVFTHDHFGPSTHQQAGLYAGVVAEPKGSVWRDNETGEIMGGYDAAANENYALRTVTRRGVEVKDGGPTSWQAVIETPDLGDSFREFLLEVQDSTLLYAPFTVGENPFPGGRPKLPEGGAVGPAKDDLSQRWGFCSNRGFCVDSTTRKVTEPAKPCPVQVPGSKPPKPCDASREVCLLSMGRLTACTPASLNQADQCGAPQEGTVYPSCNFIPGIPSTSWAVASTSGRDGGPIDNGGIEAITFNGSTNSFSFNYRNEPLFPRIDSSPNPAGPPTPKTGSQGDLAFAYSSLKFCEKNARLPCSLDSECGSGDVCVSRDSPRGKRCSRDLTPCDDKLKPCLEAGDSCMETGFCSDNYALCTSDNRSLCRTEVATCLTRGTSVPYPALTLGVEETDPFTPLLRGYAGDDIQLRVLIGAHINPHNFTLHGLNWLNQPSYVDSGWRNSQVMGISEHYNLLLKLDPQFDLPAEAVPDKSKLKHWIDYLYQPGAAAIEQAAGNWGLIRAYDKRREDLWPLPQNNYRPGTDFKSVPLCEPGAKTREYTVVALTAQQALQGPLVYNAPGFEDAGALLFFTAEDLKCAMPCGWSSCHPETCQYDRKTGHEKPDPLVLRAAAGECIRVKLFNGLPSPCKVCGAGVASAQKLGGSKLPLGASDISLEVGLRPQLVTTDSRFGDGTNAGFNPKQTASPGASVTYTWYAGHIDADVYDSHKNIVHKPIEFGAANLLPPDPLNHALHGLFGGLIVEPAGATWDNASGVSATVSYEDADKKSRSFREFVVFTSDDTNLASATGSKFAFNLVNYSTEPLIRDSNKSKPPRLCEKCPAGDASCDLAKDSFSFDSSSPPACIPNKDFTPQTPIFTANPGDEVRFRLLHPGGTNTNEVFELAGHTFLETPYETPVEDCDAPTTHANLFASQRLGAKNRCGNTEFLNQDRYLNGDLVQRVRYKPVKDGEDWSESLSEWKASRPGHGPSNHFDILIDEAGGPFHQCGDYLYRSYPADHFDLGIWGIFRVVCPAAGAPAGGR